MRIRYAIYSLLSISICNFSGWDENYEVQRQILPFYSDGTGEVFTVMENCVINIIKTHIILP